MALSLTSMAICDGGRIPVEFTADGADQSPPLAWSGAPPGTVSFAVICNDPDAPRGTWVHWLLYNLPGDSHELLQRVPSVREFDNGARHGTNDFGRIGYGGPAPPPGRLHHYRFHLYALDRVLELAAGATQVDLIREMQGHVLDETVLVGTYRR